jgi:hypothetical protein
MDFIALIVTASLNLTRNTRQVTYPQHGGKIPWSVHSNKEGKLFASVQTGDYHNSCYCSYLLTPFSCVFITRFRLPQCYICDTDSVFHLYCLSLRLMIMFACTVSCNYFIYVLFSQIYDLFLYNFLSLAFYFILHDVFLLLYFNFRYIDFLTRRVPLVE